MIWGNPARRHSPVSRTREVRACGRRTGVGPSPQSPAGPDWCPYVRIGAYGLQTDNAEQIVRNAQESDVFGIEVDNDIPGRYESFVNPEEKLRAIRAVAEKAHQAGNHAFVYIAVTECITASGDQTPHSMTSVPPACLQRTLQ